MRNFHLKNLRKMILKIKMKKKLNQIKILRQKVKIAKIKIRLKYKK